MYKLNEKLRLRLTSTVAPRKLCYHQHTIPPVNWSIGDTIDLVSLKFFLSSLHNVSSFLSSSKTICTGSLEWWWWSCSYYIPIIKSKREHSSALCLLIGYTRQVDLSIVVDKIISINSIVEEYQVA